MTFYFNYFLQNFFASDPLPCPGRIPPRKLIKHQHRNFSYCQLLFIRCVDPFGSMDAFSFSPYFFWPRIYHVLPQNDKIRIIKSLKYPLGSCLLVIFSRFSQRVPPPQQKKGSKRAIMLRMLYFRTHFLQQTTLNPKPST